MIRPRTIQVGDEAVDLTADSHLSGVSIQMLENDAETPLYCAEVHPDDKGDDFEPYTLQPGRQIQGIALGSTDHFYVFRHQGDSGPVNVILGWA